MESPEEFLIEWADYMKYRVKSRGFELSKIENILRHSGERCFDTTTHRLIAIGKHDDRLVMIPYEKHENKITPVTIHVTTRQQINFRFKIGRFKYG